MKVSREQAAKNREEILTVAAKLFRERGFDGIGVADLMKAAGLTHGGFYGHFESKEALISEACTRALAASHDRWTKVVENNPDDPLAEVAKNYLSTAHRDHPGKGCLLAALGAETSRQNAPVRRAFTDGLRPLIDLLASAAPARTKAQKRQRALAMISGLIGAMILARAVDDPQLSDEILETVSKSSPVPIS